MAQPATAVPVLDSDKASILSCQDPHSSLLQRLANGDGIGRSLFGFFKSLQLLLTNMLDEGNRVIEGSNLASVL